MVGIGELKEWQLEMRSRQNQQKVQTSDLDSCSRTAIKIWV